MKTVGILRTSYRSKCLQFIFFFLRVPLFFLFFFFTCHVGNVTVVFKTEGSLKNIWLATEVKPFYFLAFGLTEVYYSRDCCHNINVIMQHRQFYTVFSVCQKHALEIFVMKPVLFRKVSENKSMPCSDCAMLISVG